MTMCVHFPDCGGCQWMDYSFGREDDKVILGLKRRGKFDECE